MPEHAILKIKFFEKKIFFLDYFSTFGGFSVGIKENNHQKNFGRFSSILTVIIQENVFLRYVTAKGYLLFFGKSVFYHNGLEMTGKVSFTIK